MYAVKSYKWWEIGNYILLVFQSGGTLGVEAFHRMSSYTPTEGIVQSLKRKTTLPSKTILVLIYFFLVPFSNCCLFQSTLNSGMCKVCRLLAEHLAGERVVGTCGIEWRSGASLCWALYDQLPQVQARPNVRPYTVWMMKAPPSRSPPPLTQL